jgi:hypothetical protein
LKRQFEQQPGIHAFNTAGHKQKQQTGMLNRDTIIITAKLDQRPDSIGDIDFRCSEITSKMCGLVVSEDQSLIDVVCLVGSKDQSSA